MKPSKIITTAIAAGVMFTTSYMPAHAAMSEAKTNQFWWPEQLNLSPLRQHGVESNPYGENFDYAEAFLTLDLSQVKQDIAMTLKDSKDWWPADWGHYGLSDP